MTKKYFFMSVAVLFAVCTLGVSASSAFAAAPVSHAVAPIKSTVIGGTVVGMSGTLLSMESKEGVTYVVSVAQASFTQGEHAIVLADIAVGDTLIVTGQVNGKTVLASTVYDQSKANLKFDGQLSAVMKAKEHQGFFSSIANFFAGLFR
jgi:hypothetical protein